MCGVIFEPLQDFLVPHIGLFWEQVSDTYPRIEEVPIIGDITELLGTTGYVVPRIWLINNGDDQLIQLQKNRLYFNWRKRDSQYPRFEYVYRDFKSSIARFVAFLEQKGLGTLVPKRYELSYINFIPQGGAYTSLDNISSVFPDLQWQRPTSASGRFLSSPSALSWHVSIPLPDGHGEGTIKIQSAKRAATHEDVIRAELAATSFEGRAATHGMDDWFDGAHAWIVRAFEDITDETVQRESWGKL